MSEIKVENYITNEHLDTLIDQSEIKYFNAFDTVTVVLIKLPSGFVVVGKSACIDAKIFDKDKGIKYAIDDAKRQLWELQAYLIKADRAAPIIKVTSENDKKD